jgi:hypothetical protein
MTYDQADHVIELLKSCNLGVAVLILMMCVLTVLVGLIFDINNRR